MRVRPASCSMGTGDFYRALKRMETENDRSPTSGADTKNVQTNTSATPYQIQ